jgi:hypothetical protein
MLPAKGPPAIARQADGRNTIMSLAQDWTSQ